MLILSQNKKQITDNLNIRIIPDVVEDKEISTVSGYSLINEKNIYLGWYGTEERAKEILKGIVDKYDLLKIVEVSRYYEMPEK